MKNNRIKSSALFLALALVLSACGGSDSNDSNTSEVHEDVHLESAKQVLYFYGASTNDHYAFDVTTDLLENLNDDNVTALESTDSGKLFYFRDDQGDDNASNDVDKALVFKSTYSFTDDGNATWEDFYYLDHLSNGERHPHGNDEFNVTAGSKYTSMIRLNEYLAEQEQLKNDLAQSIADESIVGVGQSSQSICNFYTVIHADEGETHYFALGTNGKIYTFDDSTTNFKDVTLVSSAGCEVDKSGIVEAEEGVLVYLGSTSTIYLVDSHDDGVTHVHSEWDASEVIGDGRSIDMMVGIGSLESDGEEHDHDDEDEDHDDEDEDHDHDEDDHDDEDHDDE